MKRFVAAVCVLILTGCASAPKPAASDKPTDKRTQPPLAVFVLGTHHYHPQQSLPPIADELQRRYGFRVQVITTDYDPEHNDKGVPGLEALKQADVAVFFMRFLTLPPNQLAHISNYLASGKPIVALRTTTHAFDYPITDNRHSWNDFGRQVLGTAYYAHVGDHTDVTIAPKAGDHPILTGLPRTTTRMPSQLYTAVIPDDATPLLIGSTTGDRRVLVSQFGWTWFPPEPRYPIAWTWHTPVGAKVFTTTLGSVEDLEQPLARRLVINAIHWAVDLPAPRD